MHKHESGLGARLGVPAPIVYTRLVQLMAVSNGASAVVDRAITNSMKALLTTRASVAALLRRARNSRVARRDDARCNGRPIEQLDERQLPPSLTFA